MNSAGGPRRRKRIITDARKEQNRTAQQLYRQRQKDCVQNRENHRYDLTGKHRDLRPRESHGSSPAISQSITIDPVGAAVPEAQTQNDRDACFYENALQADFSDPGGMMHGFAPGDEFNADELLPFSMAPTSFFTGVTSGMLINTPGYGLQAPSMAIDKGEAALMRRVPASNFEVSVTNQALSNNLDSSNWLASIDATPLSRYSPQHELVEQNPANTLQCPSDAASDARWFPQSCTSNTSEGPRNLQNTSIDELLSQIPGLTDAISATSEFLYGYRGTASSCSGLTRLPSPYMNSLQSSQTATLLAFFHNARCLGLEIQELLNHKSPFYHPNTTIADDPQALLTAARRPWIPIHLQPTLEQILIPHHVYLDLLPFPALRTRAITFAATTPQLFHPIELKKDILRDGLYFHGYRSRQGGEQPWDTGSWGAAPWFLRKWRLLIG